MVLAAFFFSIMSAGVKYLGQSLSSQIIVFFRSAVALVYSYLLVRWAGQALWGEHKLLLIGRGLAGFGALTCFFFALTKLPLADATVIHYTNPIFTTFLAAFFIGESIERRELGGALLSFAGIVLIAQPAFLFEGSGLNPAYVGIALLGAVFSSIAYVIIRRLRGKEHPFVIIFYFPLIATAGSAPSLALNFVWPTPLEWLILIVGVGAMAQIAQIFLTNGLHAERAGRAMSMSYLQILFAAIWGLLFFGEMPGLLSILGTLLVVGGTVLITRPAPPPRLHAP